MAAGLSGNSYELANLYSVLDAELIASIEVRGHDAIGVYEDDIAFVDLGTRRISKGYERVRLLGLSLTDIIVLVLGVSVALITSLAIQFLWPLSVALAYFLVVTGVFSSMQLALEWINELSGSDSARVELGVPNRSISWSLPGAEYDRRIVGAIRLGVVDDQGDFVPDLPLFNYSLSVDKFLGPAPTPFRPFASSDAPGVIRYLSNVNGFGKSNATEFVCEFSIPRQRKVPTDIGNREREVKARL